ncbi:hypothetical protein Pyn_26454 [Prunus yedoensis var. nudiflora]|uniref:Uncharacterized protein n=1 Tax=Prunus yedoensis var. nudiflora TaxID=2094558 RepID=A0A314ZBL4_PRUYE|nr:hypothetical protein Pyn_23842 [Prunus yedoensis var. nudiflora]PQQ16589.1 hypothetical protein Pyn_26454 [Prunus yedoensis var. nudiflora]
MKLQISLGWAKAHKRENGKGPTSNFKPNQEHVRCHGPCQRFKQEPKEALNARDHEKIVKHQTENGKASAQNPVSGSVRGLPQLLLIPPLSSL